MTSAGKSIHQRESKANKHLKANTKKIQKKCKYKFCIHRQTAIYFVEGFPLACVQIIVILWQAARRKSCWANVAFKAEEGATSYQTNVTAANPGIIQLQKHTNTITIIQKYKYTEDTLSIVEKFGNQGSRRLQLSFLIFVKIWRIVADICHWFKPWCECLMKFRWKY